jgi:hypothetical protein
MGDDAVCYHNRVDLSLQRQLLRRLARGDEIFSFATDY